MNDKISIWVVILVIWTACSQLNKSDTANNDCDNSAEITQDTISSSDNLWKEFMPKDTMPFSDRVIFLSNLRDSIHRTFKKLNYFDLRNFNIGSFVDSTARTIYLKKKENQIELRIPPVLETPIKIVSSGRYKYFEALLNTNEGPREAYSAHCKCTDWYEETSPYHRYTICYILNDTVITYEQFVTREDDNKITYSKHIYVVYKNELQFFDQGKDTLISKIEYQTASSVSLDSIIKSIHRQPDDFDISITKKVFPHPYHIIRKENGKELLIDANGDTVRSYYNPLRGYFSSVYLWCTRPYEYYSER